jgi:citrate synthase
MDDKEVIPYPEALFEGISAQETARRLGVRVETVYSYVSRGVLSSRRVEGRRETRFDPGEVDRLAARQRRGGGRAGALEVLVDSELTFLDADTDELFYRGVDVVAASAEHGFEDVALLLLGIDPPAIPECRSYFVPDTEVLAVARHAASLAPERASPLDRYLLALAGASSADPVWHGRTTTAVAARGARIIATMVDSLPYVGTEGPAVRTGSQPVPIAERLWRSLSPVTPTAPQIRALDTALVLLADHELATSSLAARLAASTRADLYRVVIAGMATLSGPLHGGTGDRVIPMLVQAAADGGAHVVEGRRRAGEAIPGFGHLLYKSCDPRAEALLAAARKAWPDSKFVRAADDVIAAARAENPDAFANMDLAMATLVCAADMIAGGGEAIFATARTAGLVAHAGEEYQHELRFRTRTVYTGIEPGRAEVPGLQLRTSTPAHGRQQQRRPYRPVVRGASSEA